MESEPNEAMCRVVDADFKDGESYEVFLSESNNEPWHVMVSVEENGKYTHWALIQMLRAREWDIDFDWAVFMKTGRCGSSGLRHFSKKFTDGNAAFRTFREWFEEKTGNQWLGSVSPTMEAFRKLPGKYSMLTPSESRVLLESKPERERPRPKLGVTDVPVDIYFKDREQYQVYVTPDQDLWTAVMSVQEGAKHSQYAIIQVLVAKPEEKVDFDFVVFMRQGKLGGSAQRYAKRYTVEAAALATFSQWFKEKTGNLWSGSFSDSLEEFELQPGKFQLLPRSQWSELIEFEERSKARLVDGPVAVDSFYRDADLYRVYHTEENDLWAAVLSIKEHGSYQSFVILQLLAKQPTVVVDFDFVVFRRIGERGESGQWTAKKFTNELDALRTFKMWYSDETGNQWKGSFAASLTAFRQVPGKLDLLPAEEWDTATKDMTFLIEPALAVAAATAAGLSKGAIEALHRVAVAEDAKLNKRISSKELHDVEMPPLTTKKIDRAAVAPKRTHSKQHPPASADVATPDKQSVKKPKRKTLESQNTFDSVDAKQLSTKQLSTKQLSTKQVEASNAKPVPSITATSQSAQAHRTVAKQTSINAAPMSAKTEMTLEKTRVANPKPAGFNRTSAEDEVDVMCPLKRDYAQVLLSAYMVEGGETDVASKFYCIQLLEATYDVPKEEKYCFYVRAGKVGAAGGTNFRLIGSREQGERAFAKKFLEKTKNTWRGDVATTMKLFVPIAGGFNLVKQLPSSSSNLRLKK